MSRKQKKKDAREQSTRQLMGIDDITDYSIATRMGELVFFIIKPTNISVLPDAGVGARIYALLNVVKGMAEIEMLALNSKESFENNKAFYRQRANEEELPVIRKLLEQDSKHLDRIQVLMASSREFYILVRLQGKKESDVFSYLSRIEKSIKDIAVTVNIFTIVGQRAGRWLIQAGKQMKQGAFSASRWSHNRNKIAGYNFEICMIQSHYSVFTVTINL